jgi:hypothetical protein
MKEAASQPSRNNIVESQDLVEAVAKVEHEQWMHYSKDISEQIMHAEALDELRQSIKDKWAPNWTDYSRLSEEEKEKDRIWARRVLKVVKENREKLDPSLTG